jgi:two-component system, NtrC family, sensor kinase
MSVARGVLRSRGVKLARKLLTGIAVGTMSMVVLNGYLRVRREIELIETSTRENLSAMGRALRPAFVRAWRAEGRESALALLDYADQRLRRVEVRWVRLDAAPDGSNGARLDTGQRQALERREEVSLKQRARSPRRVQYVPVIAAGVPPGALELSRSLEVEQRFIRQSVTNILSTMVGVATISGVVVFLVGALLLTRPLRQLVLQARRIGSGDLSRRLRLRQQDEIGEVGREMDAMCDRLVEARERLAGETASRLAAIEELRRSSERLAGIDTLAAIAAELNSPLAVVSLQAELLASGGLDPPAAAACARIIAEEVELMARFIRRLLDSAGHSNRGPARAGWPPPS